MTYTVGNDVTHSVTHKVHNNRRTHVQNQNQNQTSLKAGFGLVCGYESIHRYGPRRAAPPVLIAASAGDGWLGGTQ